MCPEKPLLQSSGTQLARGAVVALGGAYKSIADALYHVEEKWIAERSLRKSEQLVQNKSVLRRILVLTTAMVTASLQTSTRSTSNSNNS